MTRPTSSARVRRIAYYKETPPIAPVLYDNDRDATQTDVLDVVQNDDPKLDVLHYQQNTHGDGKYLQSIPGYTSGEIGAVAATTLVIIFSENVFATNYATGVTIKINGGTQVISSATRQASKDTVRYVIPAVDANDVVTFAYSSVTGLIVSEDDAEPIATITAQTATNTVAGVAPTFVSAEIGTIGSGTVDVTFSVNVFSGNYVTGTSIAINTGTVGITSGVRQADHAVIRYVLAGQALSGDEVRWSFDTAVGGVIVNEADDTYMVTVTGQVVTNNVA